MEQKVQQLYPRTVEQMCFNELAQRRAEAENRHEQMASELVGFMLSRTVAEQEISNYTRNPVKKTLN